MPTIIPLITGWKPKTYPGRQKTTWQAKPCMATIKPCLLPRPAMPNMPMAMPNMSTVMITTP